MVIASDPNIPMFKYSETGKTLITGIGSQIQFPIKSQSELKAAENLFDEFIKNPDVTDDEKSIAGFGKSILINPIAEKSISDYEFNSIKSIIVNAIANPVSGPAGAVLAKVVIDAADKLLNTSTQSMIFQKGYKMILDSPNISNGEKKLASLARLITGEIREPYDRKWASLTFLKALEEPGDGSLNQKILGIAGDLSIKCSYNKSKNLINNKCIEAVMNSKESCEREKNIASLGLSIISEITDEYDRVRIGNMLISSLDKPAAVSFNQEILGIAGDLSSKCSYNKSKNLINNKCIEAVMNSKESDEREKTIASLGLSILNEITDDQERVRAGNIIISVISEEKQMSAVEAITYAAGKISGSCYNYNSSSAALSAGFEAVAKSNKATVFQKTLAEMALVMNKKKVYDTLFANEIRLMILDLISKDCPLKEEMEGINGSGDCSPEQVGETIDKMREFKKLLENNINQLRRDTSELQDRNKKDTEDIEGPEILLEKELKKANLANKIANWSIAPGFLSVTMASCLYQPLLLVPFFLMGAANLISNRMTRKSDEKLHAIGEIKKQIISRDSQIKSKILKIEGYSELMKDFESYFEMFSMAETVGNQSASGTQKLIKEFNDENESTYIDIGGIKIKKRLGFFTASLNKLFNN